MWRRLVCRSLGAVLLLGCGPTGYDRATYELDSVAGVLFSNSLVVSGKVLPVRTSAGLSVTYPLLFQNHGSEAASLAVGGATAKLDGQPARVVVRCGEHNYLPSATLSLQPGERIRVDCVLTLTQAGLETARGGDTEVELDVPVLSQGRLQSASFIYRLRLEDAS